MNPSKIIPKTITAISLGLALHGAAIADDYSGKVNQTLSSPSKKSDDIFVETEKLLEKAEGIHGFKIHLNQTGLGKNSGYTGDNWNDTEQLQALRLFLDMIRIYPEDFIKNAHIRDVSLMKNLRNDSGKIIGGYSTRGGKLLINTSGGNIYKFHHELFHRLDNNDGDIDDGIWEQSNKNPLLANKEINKIAYPVGYADDYGATGGINEDQATIAEYLFDPEVQSVLLQRAKSDDILRKKIMIITGCLYDPQRGVFSRDLTITEYKNVSGFSGFEYYKKWSTKYGGKPMNYEFWNKILSK